MPIRLYKKGADNKDPKFKGGGIRLYKRGGDAGVPEEEITPPVANLTPSGADLTPWEKTKAGVVDVMRGAVDVPEADVELPPAGMVMPTARPLMEVGGFFAGAAASGGNPFGAALGYGIAKKGADLLEGVLEGRGERYGKAPKHTVVQDVIRAPTADEKEQFELPAEPYPKEIAKSVRDVKHGLYIEAGGLLASRAVVNQYSVKGARKIDALIRTNLTKALKPRMSKMKSHRQMQEYAEKARAALNAIVADKHNLTYEMGTIQGELPETVAQFLEATAQTKRDLFVASEEMIVAAGERGIRISPQTALDMLKKKLDNKALIDGAPKTIDYIKTRIALLEARVAKGGYSPSEAQELIITLNQTAKEALNNPSLDTVTRAAVDSEINFHLRETLSEAIDAAEGPGYQELRNLYGSLLHIEDDVARSAARVAMKGKKGLIDFSDIFTSYVAVEAILTGNPSRFAAAGGARAMAARLKWLNNPDVLVRKMFQGMEGLAIKRHFPPTTVGREATAKAAAYMTVRGRGGREDAQIEYTP
jgi:hypothetical protein